MQVSIRTTQNVFIDQDKAGVGHRMLSMLIDIAILTAFSYGISKIIESLDIEAFWVEVLFYLPVFFYHLYMEILNNGQSLGKMIIGIKVVKLDGTPPHIGGYVLRWLLSPIDIMLGGSVAVISIGLSENGQRLGDMAANTTVIKLKKTQKVSRLQLVEKMAEDYEPMFPEVKVLSDTDVNVIKECLQVKAKHTNTKPVLLVTEKLKEKLAISSDLEPVTFLYTILRDHTYYTTR